MASRFIIGLARTTLVILVIAAMGIGALLYNYKTRHGETRRVAEAKVRELASPPPKSVGQLTQSAPSGQGSLLPITIVEVEELHPVQLVDPMVRLRFRVHLPAADEGWQIPRPEVTDCYDAEFSYYGPVSDTVRRVPCPSAAAPRPR